MAFGVAMYKAKGNLFNGFVRFWDGGVYSHCELVFSDGMCASASYRDGKQVRSKYMSVDDKETWDFIELPEHLEADARKFFEETEGCGYDLVGQIRFLIAPMHGQKQDYWCSEWVAAALGMPESWRYGPNGLAAALVFSMKVNDGYNNGRSDIRGFSSLNLS
jgi:hypothetical protein